MIARLFRAFFWAVLVAAAGVYAHLGLVFSGAREAVVLEDVLTGFEPDIVPPGKVRFVPARGLPGRVKLHRVDLGPRILPIKFRYGLKESVVLGLDDPFFVHIHLNLNYGLEPGRLRVLFRQLDRGDWDGLDALIGKKIDYFLRRRISELYTRDADLPGLEEKIALLVNGPFVGDLNAYFRTDGVVFRSVLIERLYVPDADGYRAMTEVGRREILAQKANRIRLINNAEAREQSQRITDRAYFDRLEKIGTLLRRHPQLREYLAVDRLGDKVEVMIVPGDRWFGRSEELSSPIPKRRRRDRARENLDEAPAGRAPYTPAPGRENRGFIDLTPP